MKRSGLTFSEVKKLVEKKGWILKRNTTHAIYIHPEFPKPISISHKHGQVIPTGTITKILKRADFIK